VAHARANLDEHPDVADLGTAAGLWAVLDAVIDDYEQVVELLAHEAELLAQHAFDGDRDQSESIYQHRRRARRFTTHCIRPSPSSTRSRQASFSDHPKPGHR
jgi:magnesium transporter